MSEIFKEHRPLLCEDYSDEELRFGPSISKFRRFRHSANLGRARTHAIGAASIINRWPDHLSSILAYWWIGLGMIAIMIFVLYNSFIVISGLPVVHPRPFKLKKIEPPILPNTITSENLGNDIFMHIFATSYEELNIENYLKYINEFSNKFSQFQFNIIVILKDGFNNSINNISNELNNEVALNSLWKESNIQDKIKLNKNTNIEIVSISKYMDDTPLKMYWRRLPQHFFGFLSRCVAIWEKGGIAFDPLILTPDFPNPAYIGKVEQILSTFGTSSKKTSENNIKMAKKKVNNIRDIIENLESLNKDYNIEDSLSEAENKNNLIEIIHVNRNENKRNANISSAENVQNGDVNDIKDNKGNDSLNYVYKKDSGFLSKEASNNRISMYETENHLNVEFTTKPNILPVFLEYLFRKPKNISEYSNEKNNVTLRKEVVNITSKNVYEMNNNTFKMPLPIKKYLHKNISRKKKVSKSKKSTNFTIDINGYLIATDTPCHAFIGTLFSNIIHHSYEESVTDLIIAELSIFCNGVLSSCKGVDVILL